MACKNDTLYHRITLDTLFNGTEIVPPEYFQISVRYQKGRNQATFLMYGKTTQTKFLQISVHHKKGCGIYLFFEVCYGDIYHANYAKMLCPNPPNKKVFVHKMNRKKQKKIAKTSALISDNIPALVAAWRTENWDLVAALFQ